MKSIIKHKKSTNYYIIYKNNKQSNLYYINYQIGYGYFIQEDRLHDKKGKNYFNNKNYNYDKKSKYVYFFNRDTFYL
jgi:hypothetical protein